MYKISRLFINGFKDPSRTVKLNFSREPVSVIYGDNGAGKTTLLKILHALISRDSSILLNENVKEVILYYKVEGGEHERKVRVWKNEVDLDKIELSGINLDDILDEYNWSEFDKAEFKEVSSILFGTSRGISSSTVTISPDIIIDFLERSNFSKEFRTRSRVHSFAFELAEHLRRDKRRRDYSSLNKNSINLNIKHLSLDSINMDSIESILIQRYRLAKRVTNERVQKALFDTLSVALSVDATGIEEAGLTESDSNLIVSNRERLIEALTSSPENALSDQLIRVLQKEKNFTELNNSLLPSLLLKMTSELQSEKSILNSIDFLEDVFNDHLQNGKRLVVNQDGAQIVLKDRSHSLDELSSGEKHLLSLLTLFIIEGSRRNFLLIDEPEISLNIKWQRKLLQLLNELAPDSQIIVASHSPSISGKKANYLVELL
ncbi:AAA family ATPase [Paenibacillus kribbensis]|nr:AAA family ATPase [Paenibacillus kribbensis]